MSHMFVVKQPYLYHILPSIDYYYYMRLMVCCIRPKGVYPLLSPTTTTATSVIIRADASYRIALFPSTLHAIMPNDDTTNSLADMLQLDSFTQRSSQNFRGSHKFTQITTLLY